MHVSLFAKRVLNPFLSNLAVEIIFTINSISLAIAISVSILSDYEPITSISAFDAAVCKIFLDDSDITQPQFLDTDTVKT